MFTGIVQAIGTCKLFDSGILVIDSGDLDLDRLQLGESIAVNGVCLTLVSSVYTKLTFELSQETITRSSFAEFAVGDRSIWSARCLLPTALADILSRATWMGSVRSFRLGKRATP